MVRSPSTFQVFCGTVFCIQRVFFCCLNVFVHRRLPRSDFIGRPRHPSTCVVSCLSKVSCFQS